MASRATHVERAAALAQKLFYQFKEMNYDFRVLDVEPKDAQLVIHVELRPGGKFGKFEAEMSPEEKATVVSLDGSPIAEVCFLSLLKDLLQGTGTKVRIVTLSLPPNRRVARYHFAKKDTTNDRISDHMVFLVYSPADPSERWYVDLTGPQFCIFTPCMERDRYRKAYQAADCKLISKRTTKVAYEAVMNGKDERVLQYEMCWRTVEDIEKARTDWEIEKGVRLAEVIAGQDDVEYQSLVRDFLGFVEERMTELREKFDWTERFKAVSGKKSLSITERKSREESPPGIEIVDGEESL